MNLKTAHRFLEEYNIDFDTGMGWLAAIAFTVALVLFTFAVDF
jgi:hypothetical protein